MFTTAYPEKQDTFTTAYPENQDMFTTAYPENQDTALASTMPILNLSLIITLKSNDDTKHEL
jgi:hypothetical protein